MKYSFNIILSDLLLLLLLSLSLSLLLLLCFECQANPAVVSFKTSHTPCVVLQISTCGILYPLLFEQVQLKGKVRYEAVAYQAFCV